MRKTRNVGTALVVLFMALAFAVPSISAQTGPTPVPTASPVPTVTPVPLGATIIPPDVYNVKDEKVSLPTYPSQFAVAVTNVVSPTDTVYMTLKVGTGKVLVTTGKGLVAVSDEFNYIWSTSAKNIDSVYPDGITIDANGATFTIEMYNVAAVKKGSYTLVMQRTADYSASSSSSAPTAQVTLPTTAGDASANPLASIRDAKQDQPVDQNDPWNDYAPLGFLGLLVVVFGVPAVLSRRRA